MPENPDDRTGTVRFILCDYSIRAGDENLDSYCCINQDVIDSGKHPSLMIRTRSGDYLDFKDIKAARLGSILLKVEDQKNWSFERQKKKDEIVERVLKPCIDCKFWKIRKEYLSKKLPEPE